MSYLIKKGVLRVKNNIFKQAKNEGRVLTRDAKKLVGGS